MPTVKQFDRSMIENYLKKKKINFLRDRDDDFIVNFSYDEDTGCEMSVLLMVGGEKNNIYTVQVVPDKVIPKSQWGNALMLCNTWNKERRWPKVYLKIANLETDTTTKIILEEHIDLGEGIHQELLDDYTDTVLATAFAFLKWMHQEKNF